MSSHTALGWALLWPNTLICRRQCVELQTAYGSQTERRGGLTVV